MSAIDPTYASLREQVFDWEDAQAAPGAAVGFVLETGYSDAAFTFLALSDGTVSLYFSNGGGMLGAGEHQGPAGMARELLRLTGTFVDRLPDAHANPMPQQGEARMYVLTNAGMRGIAGLEVDFGEGRSPFSTLFHAAHRVISEISRLAPGLERTPAPSAHGRH